MSAVTTQTVPGKSCYIVLDFNFIGTGKCQMLCYGAPMLS